MADGFGIGRLRINLCTFLVLTGLIAMIAGLGVRSYLHEKHYVVDAFLEIVERNLQDPEIFDRFLIDPDSTAVTVNVEMNGVVIAPTLTGARFSARGNYWNYGEKVRDVRAQMDDSARRNVDLQFGKAEITVIVLDRSKSYHVHPPIVHEQRFAVFPVPRKSGP